MSIDLQEALDRVRKEYKALRASFDEHLDASQQERKFQNKVRELEAKQTELLEAKREIERQRTLVDRLVYIMTERA